LVLCHGGPIAEPGIYARIVQGILSRMLMHIRFLKSDLEPFRATFKQEMGNVKKT
jgi:hypothetical protein